MCIFDIVLFYDLKYYVNFFFFYNGLKYALEAISNCLSFKIFLGGGGGHAPGPP